MHTTKEWLNMILSGSPHLLKCSIIGSRNVLSWWINPQNSPLWVQPHFWTSVSSSYPQYFHPPCTSSGRGPASISMMRHPSYDSSDPWFVLHLGKKRQHAGDSAVDVVTAETEETSVFLPFYTRTAPGWQRRAGGGALPALSCAHSPSQESV